MNYGMKEYGRIIVAIRAYISHDEVKINHQ